MKIKDLSLKNFTAFEQAKFNFCEGINVLIGANGTGKTHAMKAMYAVSDYRDLQKVFNIQKVNTLIRNIRNNGEDKDIIPGFSSWNGGEEEKFMASRKIYFQNMEIFALKEEIAIEAEIEIHI
jgi:predicted ATP-dependent endonuclease of OLD family